MAQPDPRVKQLKIKTGVVKRITKEKAMYEKEAQQIEEKIEKLKAEGADEYMVKKQGEVLQESKQMVPDTMKRLKSAKEDLENMMGQTTDLEETEDHKAAQEILAAAKKVLEES